MARRSLFWAVFALMCLVGKSVEAHFIWVTSEGGKARIVFGEGLEPDQAEFLDGIAGLKVLVPSPTAATFEVLRREDGGQGWFEFANPNDGPVALRCDYGVFTRGEASMRLDYAAKYQNLKDRGEPVGGLELDLTAELVNDQVKLTVYLQGKPAADIEVTMEGEKETLTRRTDAAGNLMSPRSEARLLLRAKTAAAVPGEVGGKKYSEHRYYCTLVLDPAKTAESTTINSNPIWPNLPFELTSFGGTELNGHYYVLGGQMDEAHSYSRSGQNGKLLRLNIARPDAGWETVAEGSGSQGLALVAHGGRLIRIGGFEARNNAGAEQDLHSLSVAAAFDPAEGTWKPLPSLPEPRSSFDACVIGDRLYVVGGWCLRGKEQTVWADSTLMLDLSRPESEWERLPGPPQKRRALAVIAHRDLLYAIGGMDEAAKPSHAVMVFDPTSRNWTAGPELPPGDRLAAFGCCAVELGGKLVVSVADGRFLQLNLAEQRWDLLERQLEPGRFFHRMFPLKDAALAVVGGANMEFGKFSSVEEVNFPRPETTSVQVGGAR